MKVLQTNGLKAFMASIRDKFISKSDTVEIETVNVDNIPTQNSDNLVKSSGVYTELADKLTEPSSGLAVGKYFRVASIDENGHAVLECVDAPTPDAKTGSSAPTTSTVADYVGQRYIYRFDSSRYQIFECVYIQNGTYTWREIVMNNSQPHVRGLAVGRQAGIVYGGIAFGNGAQCKTNAGDGANGLAIGEHAICGMNGLRAAQIGEGTNNTANTLQFRDYRLLEADGTIPPERITSQNWTDAQRLAVLLSLGCTVDENGYVKWTATPSA